uniref:EOG090X0IS7 n=1 Tax=Moina brachiata TaxID=675436 RepID=A0A4Y7NKM1_9CRUS|nr:EOG090X0IS7 [Moina brachiata]SVE93373.1 EOG090X0IS7 [Moina brachiata]
MPVVQNNGREKEESEGEVDHEDDRMSTQDSEKSSDDSSDDSDSEDSSEMDEDECETRRTECLDDMSDLEKQFTYLKEQLYRERITQIENKLQEVINEKAAEYLSPLAELKEAAAFRTQVAEILRQYRLENIRTKAIAEEVAASQDFESRKALLKDSIRESLNEKIRRLEEDRNQVGLLECDSILKSRSLQSYGSNPYLGDEKDPKDKDKRRKPITVTGPYIVYMLSEADIMEDWSQIRKALSATKRKEYPL